MAPLNPAMQSPPVARRMSGGHDIDDGDDVCVAVSTPTGAPCSERSGS